MFTFGSAIYQGIRQISQHQAHWAICGSKQVYRIVSATGDRLFIGDLKTLKILAVDMKGELTRVW